MSSSEFGGVYGFGMALGTLSLIFKVVFPFCWIISVVCLALDLVGFWVKRGFSVGVETFG